MMAAPNAAARPGGQNNGMSLLRRSLLAAAAAALALQRGDTTPVPLPGPACPAGTPAANQSGPGEPQCELVAHNASCASEPMLWKRRAMFHPSSECHGENDPNGVMEFGGVYHLFMQDHNPMQLGGHLATRDFHHWRRLGIAIWNDRWYDKSAIWTFSATTVDGVGPQIVYPGIAGINTSNGDCGHGPTGSGCFTHALAQPANLSDPWLLDWEKPAHLNPIVRLVNGSGINIRSRDPSTAWISARGEWRYTDASADIYSSWDFERWEWVGNLPNFGTGDCPDFFPLPPACEGCDVPQPTVVASGGRSEQPTHVRSGGHDGVYVLGIYDEGAPNTTGTWSPLPAFDPKPVDPEQPVGTPIKIDLGGPKAYYASKSFWDATKGRRIVWGWIKLANQALEVFASEEGDKYEGFKPGGCPGIGDIMTNVNSLARVVTYDALLQRLIYFPVPEMSAMRGEVLGRASAGAHIPPDKTLILSTDVKVAQSELRASFELPTEPMRIGISLLSGTRPLARLHAEPTAAAFTTSIFVDFVPRSNSSSGSGGGGDSTMSWAVSAGVDQSSMLCPNYGSRFDPLPSLSNRTSCPLRVAKLLLKASDSSLDFAVWTDNVVMEVFLMGGRHAWTVPLPCEAIVGGSGASAFASGGAKGAKLVSTEVWEVKDVVWNDSLEGSDNRA